MPRKKKTSSDNINAETISQNISQNTIELKKHVAVIHSNNKLTLVQRKIANALLYHAYPNLITHDEHQIHIVKLCNLIGYDSKDYQSIKRALVNLLSTVLEWNLVDGERLDNTNSVWNASSIIADASIDGPICTYSYSNKMRKLLYRPNIYGRLDMKIQSEFQSAYGLALYENCNRFQDIGKTPWFDISKFRKLMGVEDNKYKIFRDFKTRVLDKAVQEVNKYSPLNISPQLRKIGRQVAHIQFLINPFTPEPEINNHSLPNLPSILSTQFSCSNRQINKILASYDETYIREKINIVTTSASYLTGKVKNITSYLISALKEDYQAPHTHKNHSNNNHSDNLENLNPNKSNNNQKNHKHNKHNKYIDRFELQAIKRQEQQRLEEFRQYQNKILFTLFSEHGEHNNSDLMHKFKKFLGNGIYQDIFIRDGFKNPLIQSQLVTYLWQTNHALLSELPSYETWEKAEKKPVTQTCRGA